MFYFQTLLNQALAGIDGTGIIPAVVGVAYGILLVGFLIGLYQAVMRGGDVQALGVTAIKYVVIAIIVANWSTIFHDVNNSFTTVAQFVSNGSGDVFLNWDQQLGQQFANQNVSWFDIISGDIAALISILLIVIAYIVYVIAIVLFCFFYTLYGAVLYVLGPLILAFLPMAGVGQLSKSFATNVMIWNAWGIIYAIFGALITAINVNQVQQGLGGFLGFFQGPVNSLLLGMISIFYAISIALIPFIAKRLISGDVGATATSLVRSAAAIAGVGVAAFGGVAAGASAGSSGTGTASASGSGAASGSGGLAASSAASSSSPPPTPTLGGSIRQGLVSAMSSSSNSPAAGAATGSTGESDTGSNSPAAGSAPSPAPTPNSGRSIGFGFRPQGLAQQLAFQGGRALGRMASPGVRS